MIPVSGPPLPARRRAGSRPAPTPDPHSPPSLHRRPSGRSAGTPQGITAMTPEDRPLVNTRNAHHSTGPKSDRGKAIASRNSIRHGLSSKQVVLPNEDPAEYQALHDAWVAHDDPTDPAHFAAIESLTQAAWRKRRCARYEKAMLS